MAKTRKKSTGLSQRGSFLDRDVVAENNAILRFNEELENEARRAQGLPPLPSSRQERGRDDRPRRGPGASPRERRPSSSERPAGERPSSERPSSERATAERTGAERARPQHAASAPRRPDRPRAVDAEQEGALRAAVDAAATAVSMQGAGASMVDRLVHGDRFERAARRGWDVLVADRGGDRTTTEWEQLRAEWTGVRDAALTEWVKTHPADAPKPKPATKPARAKPGPPRRKRPEPSTGTDQPDAAGEPGVGESLPQGDPARPKRRRGPRRRGRRPGPDGASVGGVDPVAGQASSDLGTAVPGPGPFAGEHASDMAVAPTPAQPAAERSSS